MASSNAPTGQLTIGRAENPELGGGSGQGVLRRATWDAHTIVFDLHDKQGPLAPGVSGVSILAKVRIPGNESDKFENEEDDDNHDVIEAIYDADSQLYVAQLPTTAIIPKKGIKIKVVASGYKSANGRVLPKKTGVTYVGVLLQKKRSSGTSSLAVEGITTLAVDPATPTLQPGSSLRLKVTGTLPDGSVVTDPPTDISISPAGATLSVNQEDGSYQFTAVSAGTYTASFSLGPVIAMSTVTVVSPISGYKTGTLQEWGTNVASVISHLAPTANGFYDGGWNVAFATVESSAAQGGIGVAPFGQGVVVGNPSHFYLYLTDMIWATTYQTAQGGAPGALSATQGNGVTTTSSGDFGQQVLTLKFNIDFSNPPAGSTVAAGYYLPNGFGSLELNGTNTSLDGSTVSQVLAAANLALGGGTLPAGFTYVSLNDLVVNLNGSFDGGTSSVWAGIHLRKPTVAPSYRLFVGNFGTTSITEYSLPVDFTPGSTLDLTPTCKAIIDTGFSNSPCGLSFNPSEPDQVFVTDENAQAVKEYSMPINGPSPANATDGTSQTLNTLVGPNTGMYNPQGIAVDGQNLYVTSTSGRYISVTPLNWTAGQAPSQIIQLPASVYGVPVGLAVDTKNNVLVATIGADGSPGSEDCVAVFDLTTYQLVQSFKGPNCHFFFPRGVAVDNTVTPAQIFVCNANPDGAIPNNGTGVWTMEVFQLDRNATVTDVTPRYLVSGPNYHLVASSAASVTGDGKYLAVSNAMWGLVNLFDLSTLRSAPVNSTIDLAPALTIAGASTQMASPNAMAIK